MMGAPIFCQCLFLLKNYPTYNQFLRGHGSQFEHAVNSGLWVPNIKLCGPEISLSFTGSLAVTCIQINCLELESFHSPECFTP